MSRGFTLSDIAFVLLLLFLVGLVAVPGILDRTRVAQEAGAVRALQWIAAAQARFLSLPASAVVDRDGDGQAEHGFLPDLLRETPADGDWGPPPPFMGAVDRDILEVPGFYVTILLPAEDGAPLMLSRADRVDAAAAARTFAAVAWPMEAGRTGYRTYYVNHSLIVHENPNRENQGGENQGGENQKGETNLSGPMLPVLPSPVLFTSNARTGAIVPPPALSPPWTMFLRRDQEKLLAKRLGRTVTRSSEE
ncbi:MAG: hypothetical protein ABFS86_06715 [Planctomycetota bacterium]